MFNFNFYIKFENCFEFFIQLLQSGPILKRMQHMPINQNIGYWFNKNMKTIEILSIDCEHFF